MLIPRYRILGPAKHPEGKSTQAMAEAFQGGPAPGGPLRIFPGGRELQLREAENLGGDRYLLTLKGVPRRELREGAFLIPGDWPVTEGKEAVFLDDGKPLPRGKTTIRGGIDPFFNQRGLAGGGRVDRRGAFLLVRFSQPFPLLPGGVYTLPPPQEESPPRPLTLLYPGALTGRLRHILEASLRRRPHPAPPPEEIYGRLLHGEGFTPVPPLFGPERWPEAERLGSWMILKDRWQILARKIIKAVSRPGGGQPESMDLPGIPSGLLAAGTDRLLQEGRVVRKKGWLFPPGPPPLSPFLRNAWDQARQAGEEGLRVLKLKTPAWREAFVVLARSGLVVGGEEVYFERGVYEEMAERLLRGKKSGQGINIAQVREFLRGSRLTAIEFLTILEEEGRLLPDREGKGRAVP